MADLIFDMAISLRSVGVSDDHLKKAYDKSKENSREYRQEKWDDYLTSMLKGDTLTEENLLRIYNKNPKVLEKEFGFELEVVDGRVLPKDKNIREDYMRKLNDGWTPARILNYVKKSNDYPTLYKTLGE